MGTTTEKPGYIPLMIFSVLFTAFVVLFACRCKYRSRNNKIKNSSPSGSPNTDKRTFALNNMRDMPDVEQQQYSPVLQAPMVTVECALAAEPRRDQSPGDSSSDRNGAHTQV